MATSETPQIPQTLMAKAPAKPPAKAKKTTATPVRKPAVRKQKAAKEERVEAFEKKPDGTRLIRAINQRMVLLGIGPVEVAQALDMSYSYFITLANDSSRFAAINRRFVRNIARFLGITTIMAYQYAGFFEEEDITADVNVDKLLAKSRNNMEADPVYSFYVRTAESWDELPLRDRMLCHFLYADVEIMRPKILESQDMRDENLQLRKHMDALRSKYVDLQAQASTLKAENTKLRKQLEKAGK